MLFFAKLEKSTFPFVIYEEGKGWNITFLSYIPAPFLFWGRENEVEINVNSIRGIGVKIPQDAFGIVDFRGIAEGPSF